MSLVESVRGETSDAKFKAMSLISADPAAHVAKIKALQQLGPTARVFMRRSGGGGDAQPLPDLPSAT